MKVLDEIDFWLSWSPKDLVDIETVQHDFSGRWKDYEKRRYVAECSVMSYDFGLCKVDNYRTNLYKWSTELPPLIEMLMFFAGMAITFPTLGLSWFIWNCIIKGLIPSRLFVSSNCMLAKKLKFLSDNYLISKDDIAKSKQFIDEYIKDFN